MGLFTPATVSHMRISYIPYPQSITLNGFNFILGLKDSEAFLHLAGRRILPVDTEYDPEDILQRSLAAGLLNRLPNVDDEAFGLDVDADVLVFYYQHVLVSEEKAMNLLMAKQGSPEWLKVM